MSTCAVLAKLTPEATIAEIISADEKAGQLLASIGMEPMNHKDETLRSVCQQLKWSEEEVLKWVKKNRLAGNGREQMPEKPAVSDYGDNIVAWCNYIMDECHPRLLSLLGDISRDFPRLHKVHGNQYIWLKHMQWPLESLEEKLQFYTYFECKKLFPVILSFSEGKQEILDGTIRKIERGIKIVEEDQKELQRLMNRIERQGNGLKNPKGACTTLRILNYNLEKLFAILRDQFELEGRKLLPLLRSRLKTKV